jgi:hypothetical protein
MNQMTLVQSIDPIDAPDLGQPRLGAVIDPASPSFAGLGGEVRLGQGTAGINRTMTGVSAHAAVRMHLSPATGVFWVYCPKDEATHFQRWKVAT